ncbi:hypothetical protein IHE45_05G138600 [Dioscorea alata]|uniref:Uncharacterized protein n=1 Tax=Dioscorea alata TaxID=55571 RepID=A0ACB7W5I5_DIOAL|nr:hypothetical protein IHE45_05G138600 [Dioscorea alata]
MWRQSASPGGARNPHSKSLPSSRANRVPDRNLSDDDEELDEITYGDDSLESLRSLYSNHTKKKHEISLAENENARRELENDSCDHRKSLLMEELDHDSGDESISDEDNNVLSNFLHTSGVAKAKRNNDHGVERKRQEVARKWSAVSEEANEFVYLNEKTPSSSFRGSRGRAKPKFSIHSYTHMGGMPSSHGFKVENEILPPEGIKNYADFINLHETNENSMSELLGDLQEEKTQLLDKFISHKPIAAPSMAELLEGLQENNHHFLGASNLFLQNDRPKGRRRNYIAGKKTTCTLGPRILDDEDPPEFVDDRMSSDDEDNYNDDIRYTTHPVKGQTMADLFQEAFSTAASDEPVVERSCRQPRVEFHQRLQRVMQTEKEISMEFLKRMQEGWVPRYESKFMDVQILSRVLEAKLTVCWCLLGENIESSEGHKSLQLATDVGTLKMNVIFSSKICDNVELEVGNRVRIYSPWYVLALYFHLFCF